LALLPHNKIHDTHNQIITMVPFWQGTQSLPSLPSVPFLQGAAHAAMAEGRGGEDITRPADDEDDGKSIPGWWPLVLLPSNILLEVFSPPLLPPVLFPKMSFPYLNWFMS